MSNVGSGSTDDSKQADTLAEERVHGVTSRRSFLAGAGGGVAAVGVGLLVDSPVASAQGRLRPRESRRRGGRLTRGDAAILRFLAAAEILETDLWQQYNELGGIQDSEVPGGSGNPAYAAALAVLDEDMAQYIHDNTEDEITHFTFLNAYLESHGRGPVNLDRFRTLPEQQGDRRPADRAADQPDAADRGHQLVDALSQRTQEPGPRRHASRRPFPAWPKGSFRPSPAPMPTSRPQTTSRQSPTPRAFHFAIHRAGRHQPLSVAGAAGHDAEVLRVLLSIGPTETMHFQTWHDKAGNAPPLTDPDQRAGVSGPELAPVRRGDCSRPT